VKGVTPRAVPRSCWDSGRVEHVTCVHCLLCLSWWQASTWESSCTRCMRGLRERRTADVSLEGVGADEGSARAIAEDCGVESCRGGSALD
jgi:hypothetical protein